ncbi:hypothetical protein JOM56_005554 [Amanita muscaria]
MQTKFIGTIVVACLAGLTLASPLPVAVVAADAPIARDTNVAREAEPEPICRWNCSLLTLFHICSLDTTRHMSDGTETLLNFAKSKTALIVSPPVKNFRCAQEHHPTPTTKPRMQNAVISNQIKFGTYISVFFNVGHSGNIRDQINCSMAPVAGEPLAPQERAAAKVRSVSTLKDFVANFKQIDGTTGRYQG